MDDESACLSVCPPEDAVVKQSIGVTKDRILKRSLGTKGVVGV